MAEAGIRSLLQTAARYLVSGGAATLLHWGTMAALIAAVCQRILATAYLAGATPQLCAAISLHLSVAPTACHDDAALFGHYVLSWCSNNAVFALIHGLTGLLQRPRSFDDSAGDSAEFFPVSRFVFNEPHHVLRP